MKRGILDQNGIILLNDRINYDAIIITPMFIWELFNNINSKIEKKLIHYLRSISDRIVITFKSTSCEEIELESGMTLSYDRIINQEITHLIKQWLQTNNTSISDIRDTLSTGLISTNFMGLFNDLAEGSWLPKLNEEFKRSNSAKDRQLTRNKFETLSNEMAEYLCSKSISVCYDILKSKKYTHKQAILFLKEPSILYNRVFCCIAIFTYRSTQAGKNSLPIKFVANDNKDTDYLFLAHHAEDLISNDNLVIQIFLLLKKSYDILKKMETGL